MKNLKFSTICLSFLIIIASCKKKDTTPANYFSFKGKTYEIVEAYVGQSIIAHQPLDSTIIYHVHQLVFFGIAGKDSATLGLAVGDEATSTLNGNYSALPVFSSASRGIIPEAVDSQVTVANSVIILGISEGYETGAGGSLDITPNGSDYVIGFHAISAGLYSNFYAQYNEIGKINGKYSGPLQLAIFSNMPATYMFEQKRKSVLKEEFKNH